MPGDAPGCPRAPRALFTKKCARGHHLPGVFPATTPSSRCPRAPFAQGLFGVFSQGRRKDAVYRVPAGTHPPFSRAPLGLPAGTARVARSQRGSRACHSCPCALVGATARRGHSQGPAARRPPLTVEEQRSCLHVRSTVLSIVLSIVKIENCSR